MNRKPLIIRDEIHGDITLGWVSRAVVDHPSFQRLRQIKQLGLAEYVFPCATHTRFQHSLGAAFLAKQYFESLVETLPQWDFQSNAFVGDTEFLVSETKACLASVVGESASRDFWSTVCTLSGLLHDVGHGPWSHTFEYLALEQDFASAIDPLSGVVRSYFDSALSAGEKLHHEDLSVLYVFKILSELSRAGEVPQALSYFLPVSLLVNKRMRSGDLRDALEQELDQQLKEGGIRGGVSALRLLAPLISGPFDVDRADYIQRDGRNCGVSLGGIEWTRIVRKVMPCLARHTNSRGEPNDVVLVSNLRNQHVLDDFIFSLFQMYAQVYLHPKIVAFEEEIRRELEARVGKSPRAVVSFELHESLSDEGFRNWLERHFGAESIRSTLYRSRKQRFQTVGLPDGIGERAELGRLGYRSVASQERLMLKDVLGVFLYSNAGEKEVSLVVPWREASPIVDHFQSIRHSSEIWIRPDSAV
jgi:HD superfamily phosphohydrolase